MDPELGVYIYTAGDFRLLSRLYFVLFDYLESGSIYLLSKVCKLISLVRDMRPEKHSNITYSNFTINVLHFLFLHS